MVLAEADTYRTDPERTRSALSRIILGRRVMFYPQVFWIIWINSRKAARNQYSADEWAASSFDILVALENVGVQIEIAGMDNIRKLDGPAVFVGNHMSTLETFVLPAIIQPVRPVTFVVKKSLSEMPVFGPIMRSRDPIVVSRVNARDDLKTVITGGIKKMEDGISVVIFPQSTRSAAFNPEDFNSLGIKLAARAGVPVVPFALKTDAWGTGKYIKDFGPIDVNRKVFFSFGEPMQISGRGTDEHQAIISFIERKLREWTTGQEN